MNLNSYYGSLNLEDEKRWAMVHTLLLCARFARGADECVRPYTIL